MFILIVVAVVVNIVIANRLDAKHKKVFADSPPFKWFYYFGLGWSELACAGVAVYIVSFVSSAGGEPNWESVVSLLIFVGVLYCCYEYFKMKSWAFTVLSVLSMNIAIWIAHPSYYSKRKQYFVL